MRLQSAPERVKLYLPPESGVGVQTLGNSITERMIQTTAQLNVPMNEEHAVLHCSDSVGRTPGRQIRPRGSAGPEELLLHSKPLLRPSLLKTTFYLCRHGSQALQLPCTNKL